MFLFELLAGVAIAAAWIAALGCLIFLVNYFDHRSENSVHLKFSDFKTYYALNPKRYCVDDTTPYVEMEHGLYSLTPIQFSFIDYVRYALWTCQLHRKAKMAEHDKKLERYLKCVMEDIDATKALAQAQMDEALKRLDQINI